ncbi:MAG: M42 family metallopeptidase [Thermomicrobiales bacterium]
MSHGSGADLNFDLLKRICETPGIAGREDAVRALVREELAGLVDDVSVDALGNVVGVRKGQGGPRVLVMAHMDEIGFMVKHIDEKGFIRLHPVGGFDPRVLPAQRVIVHGFKGEQLRGALQIGAKPIHLLDPGDIKPPKLEELFVDLGLSGDDVKQRVEVGDMITLDRTVERVGDNVMGKSLDDRICVFQMIEALRRLSGPTQAEIVAVATTQEEIGLRGATTASYNVDAQIAVALDITLAQDIPGGADQDQITRLNSGAAIKIMDSSTISNYKLVRHLRDVADANDIPYQLEILPRGGTDAGGAQRTRGGVPAITISIPTRYVHTVNEMASIADVNAAVSLLARYLESAHEGDYGFE